MSDLAKSLNTAIWAGVKFSHPIHLVKEYAFKICSSSIVELYTFYILFLFFQREKRKKMPEIFS